MKVGEELWMQRKILGQLPKILKAHLAVCLSPAPSFVLTGACVIFLRRKALSELKGWETGVCQSETAYRRGRRWYLLWDAPTPTPGQGKGSEAQAETWTGAPRSAGWEESPSLCVSSLQVSEDADRLDELQAWKKRTLVCCQAPGWGHARQSVNPWDQFPYLCNGHIHLPSCVSMTHFK